LSALLKPIQLAINATLDQDLESKARLEQFELRRITVVVSDFNQTISILFKDCQVELSTDNEQTADLTITAKAVSLIKLGQDPENLFSADIDINGDVQFAKQLRDFLEGFDFDWEAQLAKLTGDTLAYPIAHGLRQAGSWLKASHQSLQYSLVDYLKEEAQILPDKSQINEYMTEIDSVRADLDRLEARINRL